VTAITRSRRPKREYENDEFAAFVRRILRAYRRRVGTNGDIAALSGLVELRAEVDAAIDQAVCELRSEPWCYSWGQIADELGISRQAASMRWNRVAKGDRKAGGQPSRLR